MECRPPMEHVHIQGNPLKPLKIVVEPSLADHPLVVGPRYLIDDFVCSWSNYLGFHTSGVLRNVNIQYFFDKHILYSSVFSVWFTIRNKIGEDG